MPEELREIKDKLAAIDTKSALAMYERDERIPRDEAKIIIAEYYGESVQSLFFSP